MKTYSIVILLTKEKLVLGLNIAEHPSHTLTRKLGLKKTSAYAATKPLKFKPYMTVTASWQ